MAKNPRASTNKGKGKIVKEKAKTEKEKGSPVMYDNIEGSVHDVSLRQDLLRGYERFKAS